jgi:hypothetical protein
MTMHNKNRVRSQKQNSISYNKNVKQRKDTMTNSLMSSISNLFNATIQNSLLSSQVEEISSEDMRSLKTQSNLDFV